MGASPRRADPAEAAEPAARDDDASRLLLDAALDLVRHEGVAGLTLRPLASRLGVTPSYLTGRFGAKAGVIRAVIAAARRRSEAFRAGWTSRLEAVARLAPAQAADVCEVMLDDIVLNHAALCTLYLECFQARAWDEALADAFAGWLDDERAFWDQAGQRLGLPEDILSSRLFGNYVIDELAYSLCLSGDPAYRLMRKLTMNRLFDGFRPPADGEATGRLFFQVFAELDYDVSALRVVHGAALSGEWPERVMRAAARLIVTSGVSAVTHRAAAALADVKPTTLAYRFPTQEDLVVGGLEHIISRLLTRLDETGPAAVQLDPAGEDAELDIGRASFAVALAAVRMDRLKPCAGDMRRRRGINLIKVLDRQFEAGAGLDAASAQAISAGLTVFTIAPAQERPLVMERTARAFQAAVDWARRARAADGARPATAVSPEGISYNRFPVSSRDG